MGWAFERSFGPNFFFFGGGKWKLLIDLRTIDWCKLTVVEAIAVVRDECYNSTLMLFF